MKRSLPLLTAVLMGAASAAAGATFDLQYHPPEAADRKVGNAQQPLKPVPRHQIWNAEKLAQDNQRAESEEQAQALADYQRQRQRAHILGEQRERIRRHPNSTRPAARDYLVNCMPPGDRGSLKWDDEGRDPSLCGRISWD
ncbi:hypothetical protein CLM71_13430 [Serratia sp. MYb239]|uniref:hypothetical protein n=1 Tax=Serratia sp. MYb239 TaxID=2033438 RepID=UPI000CF675F7|nr:hypothetical protein [Serratia sp. MYb239]AVJ18058.1 hypothetical protein CLM71_13430 [Serratia sp. MYb239]MBU3894718.1 hypothetical protein [Serratia rubidaea]MCA4822939.1 hypothetical protein [Serratia rubidaea]QPT11696.1 hypothetical protein I6G37_14315 [Serratia rubidaea]